MKSSLFAGVALAALVSSTAARAETTELAAGASRGKPEPVEFSPTPPAAPVGVPPAPTYRDRGRFSGKRLVVEMLAGAVVGSAASVAAYKVVGGDGIGAVFDGLGANIAVTPLAMWGVGKAMGGRGTIGWTYLGGLNAFAGPSMPELAAVSFAVGVVLIPVTSAIVYEISSHARSRRFEAVTGSVAIAPIVDQHGVSGVRAGLAFGS